MDKFFLFVSLLFFSTVSLGEKDKNLSFEFSGFSTPLQDESKIVGCFVMIPLPKYLQKKLYWSEAYQWLYFSSDKKLLAFRTSVEQEFNCKKLKKTLEPVPKKVSWTLEVKGSLIINYHDLRNPKEIWKVNLVTKSKTIQSQSGISFRVQRGDLIMSLQKNGKTTYRQHLRPLD